MRGRGVIISCCRFRVPQASFPDDGRPLPCRYFNGGGGHSSHGPGGPGGPGQGAQPHGGSRDNSSVASDSPGYKSLGGGGGGYTSTLTPMHLRKAKLMFFYVRYPSSAILKMYFPDINFNKNNTAQLVKWFSNFREFYYIQMEKYARQSVSEGVKNVEELKVSADSELLRVLNLHYNRNNHIEVRYAGWTYSETIFKLSVDSVTYVGEIKTQ